MAAFAGLPRIFGGFVDRLADVEFQSVSELADLADEFLRGPESEEASDRYNRACFELQKIAHANDINLNLKCVQ